MLASIALAASVSWRVLYSERFTTSSVAAKAKGKCTVSKRALHMQRLRTDVVVLRVANVAGRLDKAGGRKALLKERLVVCAHSLVSTRENGNWTHEKKKGGHIAA